MDTYCSPDVEFLTIKCRPFYLPREFTTVVLTAVYIAPTANACRAMSSMHENINAKLSRYPEAARIIAGDFTHTDVRAALPKSHQHIECAIRGESTLDKVYTNIRRAYEVKTLAHLGGSDHVSLLLTPVYTPLRKQGQIQTRMVTVWPEGASQQLQDCFQETDWNMFDHQDLETYTSMVLDYIRFCTANVTREKYVKLYPNRKPWMTGEVRRLLKARNSAFRTGDRVLYGKIGRAHV